MNGPLTAPGLALLSRDSVCTNDTASAGISLAPGVGQLGELLVVLLTRPAM